jgi:hypothetical protein
VKRIFVYCGILAALVLLFGSCATGPYVQRDDKVLKLVDLINRGGVNEVQGLSETPFLFDGEVLLLQKDVTALWTNLKAAGFTMRNSKVAGKEHISDNSYRAFGDSMEVRTFFKRYLDKNSSLVKIGSEGGSFYLLLNREIDGYPRIQGFKGPIQ